jgi:hypothetical protein
MPQSMARTFILAAVALLALAGCTTSTTMAPPEAFKPLHAAYNDQPFKGGQMTPQHEWYLGADKRLLFIHWDAEDPAKATKVLWVGDGFYAKGCIGPGGVSAEQVAAGFVHFHKETSPQWDQAHHTVAGNPDVMGYWLRHIQVDPQAAMPGTMPSPVGEVYKLMDSTGNAPSC